MLGSVLIGTVRTVVPVVVGYLITQLADVGIEVDETALTTVVTGLIVGGYYLAARLLENLHPWFGVLLGWINQPRYDRNVIDASSRPAGDGPAA